MHESRYLRALKSKAMYNNKTTYVVYAYTDSCRTQRHNDNDK